jgi:hypothetical protein
LLHYEVGKIVAVLVLPSVCSNLVLDVPSLIVILPMWNVDLVC